VVVFVVITARRLGSRGWALALGLLLAGSVGNLTDRMFRAPGPGRGQVVDFLELPHYPIFNIADSAIVSAAVLIAVMAFRGIGIDGTRMARGGLKSDNPGNDNPEGNLFAGEGPQGNDPEKKNPQSDDPQTHRSGSENSSAPHKNPTGKAQDV
jgi:signal peptidase II